VRAALTVSTATDRAGSIRGSKIEARIEPAVSVAVDTDRAALSVSAATDRAGSICVSFLLPRRELLHLWQQARLELLYLCLLPRIEQALSVSQFLLLRQEQFFT